jgi:hypothetical protein
MTRLLITLVCLLESGPALAQDVCSAMFQTESRALQARHCDARAARAELEPNLTPACLDAARRGDATQSLERLQAILLRIEEGPCQAERWVLAAHAVCTLKARQLDHQIAELAFSEPRYELDRQTLVLCQAAAVELGELSFDPTDGYLVRLGGDSRNFSAASLCRLPVAPALAKEACARAAAPKPKVLSEDFKRELRWRIGVGVATLALSVGMATAIGLTRDREWLAGTHLALAVTSLPVCASLSGASGNRFTSILWLVLGIPVFAAAGAAVGYLTSSSSTGRVVAGTLASGLSLATAEAMIWNGLKR